MPSTIERVDRALDVRIAPLLPKRAAEAGGLLAASLDLDPAWRSLFPDPPQRAAALATTCGIAARDAASLGTAAAASGGDGRLLGVAVWLAPGAFPISAGRKARAVPAMLPLVIRSPRQIARWVAFGARVESAFPDEAVWYLEILGVAPDAQRRGIGRALLEDGLRRADADGHAAYLETSTADNVGYYQRFGFGVEREITLVPDGPPHWTMRRPIGG